jgi:hypothetical protein
MRTVPRSLGLAAGWVFSPISELPISPSGRTVHPHGAALYGDFLWQVGGIDEGWPSYIGFLTQFSFYPAGGQRRHALSLEYGILVKHFVFPQRVVRPFVTYGLGATQVWVLDVRSRGIGHLTRLSLGLDMAVSRKVSLSVEMAYRIANLPTFAVAGSWGRSYDFHTLSALAGIHFNI